MSDVNGSMPDRQIQQSKGAQTVAQAGSTPRKGSIGVIGATTIGVGGMMGAGIYTLVGLAATTTGVWLPVAFLVGGFVSAFSVYSYARLGIRFPSRGGAAQFLVQGFGDGIVAGGLNIFQFLGYVIAQIWTIKLFPDINNLAAPKTGDTSPVTMTFFPVGGVPIERPRHGD